MQSKQSQALFSHSQWQDQRQHAQTETQELPSEHQETLFQWEDDQEMAQIAHRGCGISILRDILRSPSGLMPDKPAKGSTVWTNRLDQLASRASVQTQPFCDSVIWMHIARIQTLQDGKNIYIDNQCRQWVELHPVLLFYYCLCTSRRGDGSAEFTNFHFCFLSEAYSILIYPVFTKFFFHWSKAIQVCNFIFCQEIKKIMHAQQGASLEAILLLKNRTDDFLRTAFLHLKQIWKSKIRPQRSVGLVILAGD